MTKAATFSNGQVDVYKGSRPVRAAWQVILPNGKALSGHSLDRAKAEKTARANAADWSGAKSFDGVPGRAVPAHFMAYREKEARKAGFNSYREQYEDLAAKRAAFVASCKIEIVDLAGA